jgi:hypothetical protein
MSNSRFLGGDATKLTQNGSAYVKNSEFHWAFIQLRSRSRGRDTTARAFLPQIESAHPTLANRQSLEYAVVNGARDADAAIAALVQRLGPGEYQDARLVLEEAFHGLPGVAAQGGGLPDR